MSGGKAVSLVSFERTFSFVALSLLKWLADFGMTSGVDVKGAAFLSGTLFSSSLSQSPPI